MASLFTRLLGRLFEGMRCSPGRTPEANSFLWISEWGIIQGELAHAVANTGESAGKNLFAAVKVHLAMGRTRPASRGAPSLQTPLAQGAFRLLGDLLSTFGHLLSEELAIPSSDWNTCSRYCLQASILA
jgi:hypothetical protein